MINRIRLMFRSKPQPLPDDDLSAMVKRAAGFADKLSELRVTNPLPEQDGFWFPYGILSNLSEINATLTGKNRDLKALANGKPIADIGGADGDLSFFLESEGFNNLHLIDWAEINCNKQKGAYVLKEQLNSKVNIHDINIEPLFDMPEKEVGLTFLLGTVYHLKSPFAVLENLSRQSRYCIMSTRITRCLPGSKKDMSALPIGYLLGETELNNDPTNFWVFTKAGLRQLVYRAGWDVLDFKTFSATSYSMPNSVENGERAFCLLKSRAY